MTHRGPFQPRTFCYSVTSIRKDDRALGEAVRDSGALVVFPSVLPVKGTGLKGPLGSDKSTNGYRTGATAKDLVT